MEVIMVNKKISIVIMLFILSLSFTWSETSKDSIFSWDTKQFHFGFGATITTGNLLGLIESAKLYDTLYNNKAYDYPGLTPQQQAAVSNLNKGMTSALIAANILATMQYGIRTRLMYHVFISDIDLIFLPCDGTYNGRFDFQLVPTIGIRMPWFIMPYITAGPSFTFSFYPDKVVDIENWKTKAGYGVVDKFVFRPGLNIRVGADLNFRRVTIGAFYQYEIKDFAEFTDYYNSIVQNGFSSTEAAGKIFGYQSRFGVSLVINVM
jgi:hypothetical protein